MKNYYEILGVAENAPTEEIVHIGRKLLQEYSVEHRFAGKQMGKDYTAEEWKEANYAYAQIIEAYQILKDERKRTEYNYRLREFKRQKQQEQQRTQQTAYDINNDQRHFYDQDNDTSYDYYSGRRKTANTSQRTGRYQGAHQATGQRQRTAQGANNTQNTQRTQRTQRYSKTHTANTTQREPRREEKQKSGFGKMVDSFKEVRKEEKEYPLFERHQDLNREFRRGFHKNVRSVPGEIVYQMANGTLHVTYEFIHQLRKLSYINEDSFPKYVFRNRKLAAAAIAIALMAGANGSDANEMINIEQPPAVTVTQESEVEDNIGLEQDIIYEEPTVQMTQYYEVVKGDTLSDISTRTGVKVYEIQEANNRYGTDKIYIGETLTLNYTIDKDDLHYYTIAIPAKGMTCRDLAKQYRTDEETIKMLNKEAIAYINGEYTILTDSAVVPNFISVEQLDMMKQTATGRHN